jgi:dTMP kinase
MKGKRGIFITFEGAEGSGKSTQIRFAASFFRRKGRSVLLVREPGSTKVSEAVRQVLLDPKLKGMSKEAELLLYLAARAQLVREKILPALQAGKVVIADRYEDSTVVYQGFGEGISLRVIQRMSEFVRGNLKPDLTFVLDVDPKRGFKRGGRHDRVERKSDAFHLRVRRGFLTLAKRNKKRIVLLSTARPIKEVREQICHTLIKKFK